MRLSRAILSALLLPLLGASRLRSAADPAREFPDTKVYSSDGQPWRVPIEDWTGARRRIAADPAWASWLRHERAEVDDWIARRHDRVAWQCGWYHDFVSPKDGSHITWTPDVPGEDVPYLHSPSDPRIEITPKIKGGWVFDFRAAHAEMMVRAAKLYRLTGERNYGDWAAAQLDFYAQHYLDWKPHRKGEGARIFWQDLDEASFGTQYIETVRLLGNDVASDRRQGWWVRLFAPVAAVLDHDRRMIHNIATWQRCAMAEFALVYHDEALWKRAIEGPFGVREQLDKGITADAIWYEQSFHYNEFVVQALLGLCTQAGLQRRSVELAPEMVQTENLMLSPLYLRFPNGLLPNPADGTGIEVSPHRAFLAQTYRVFPTTLGLTEAAHRRDWDTLIDSPPPSPRPDVLPVVTSRSLEASRMAVLKEGPWQVFFHYGQLTASHSQSEALNFSVCYNAVDLTHDPGTTGYGSPFHQFYFTKGLNHNVPLIGGEGETPPKRGKLDGFSATPARVAAEQPDYNPKAVARRSLAIEGGRLVDTAEIRTRDGSTQALGLALHVQGKVRLPAAFQPATDFTAGRPRSFTFWKGVTGADYRDQASFNVVYEGVEMRVTFRTAGHFRIWHGSTPDVPPKRREGFYLETQGADAVFTTTFEPLSLRLPLDPGGGGRSSVKFDFNSQKTGLGSAEMADKGVLRSAILAQLEAELAMLTAAAQSARDEATDQENRQEGKYDMRAQTAAYLAAGQSKLATELAEAIAAYRSLPVAPLPPGSAAAVGALLVVESAGHPNRFLLGPARGGLEIPFESETITVVTPASPLGRQLLGRKAGDLVAPGRRLLALE